MPITIAICDNEKNTREESMHMVKSQCEDCHVDLYDSGIALLAASKEYDIYILEILLPGINGIETAKLLREKQSAQLQAESMIIFITAHKEYMDAAFDVKAFHYLVKPIDEDKFKAVISRAINDCRKIKENAESHILIKNGNLYHKVFLSDIFYVESRDKKVIINSVNGAVEYYGRMQEIENILGNTFFRCHRCYIVNMKHITQYNFNTIWVKNGDAIYLAQKRYSQFVNKFMMFTNNGEPLHG